MTQASPKDTDSASLFDRLGGVDALSAVVTAFYDRVLADPLLMPFFEGVDRGWLERSQAAFLTAAADGPDKYNGRDMRSAHARMAVEEQHFTAVAVHLEATLRAAGVADELIAETLGLVGPLASQVVNTTQPATSQAMSNSAATLSDVQAFALLENAPTNVIVADTDLVITYVNPASVETLKGLQDLLPCPVDELLGQSIDIFHSNPAMQRRLLSDPANLPHRATITLGEEKLDLLVSAITDDAGNYTGPMVTWEIVTEQLCKENEIARITSMVESAPINIMCAGLDHKIQYMNPASFKTLKAIEHLLPIKAEEAIGQAIDIFHRNPELQQRIVKDPANLPHSAQIQVGEETLDLLVSAMYGAQGDYLGPMVTWEVITERLRTEQEIVDAQERERTQAEELRMKVDEMLKVVNAAADGDLTQEVHVKGEDAIGQMGEGLARFISELRSNISQIAENAQTLAGASEELTAVSQQMSANSEETTSQARVVTQAAEGVSENVQTVASGTEEMTASIREIALNAANAAKVATDAVTAADDTNATVGKLGDSSAEIGQVIKVITSIAQQTNLLALNATIEAARAGEAGKGFAVVANEVKELAKETAKATEDISRKIETIQSDTGEAVTAIGRIGTIIREINEIQGTIASAVEEQTATTNEMARNVENASRGTGEIAETIRSVASAAEQTSVGAADTQQSSSGLSRMAADLQALVSRFQF
jgi:methyl-accepting chemotaxis protein